MDEKQWIQEICSETDKDYKVTDKQTRILEAAIEMFAEKGYSYTSTSEIAKKAGVAEGTIFCHYKTKKELLLAIVTPTLTKIVAPIIEKNFVKDVFEKKHDSYEDFLRVLITNRYKFVKSRVPILRIFLQEVAFHDDINAEIKKLFTNRVYQQFTRIVVHFQSKGQLKSIPADTIIRLTITSIIGLLVTRFLILPEHNWDDVNDIENTIQFIISGLTS